MALVSSVQHLAPLMNSMLTSERPSNAPPVPLMLVSLPQPVPHSWAARRDLGSDILLSSDHWEFSDSQESNSFLFLPWPMLCPPIQNTLS